MCWIYTNTKFKKWNAFVWFFSFDFASFKSFLHICHFCVCQKAKKIVYCSTKYVFIVKILHGTQNWSFHTQFSEQNVNCFSCSVSKIRDDVIRNKYLLFLFPFFNSLKVYRHRQSHISEKHLEYKQSLLLRWNFYCIYNSVNNNLCKPFSKANIFNGVP